MASFNEFAAMVQDLARKSELISIESESSAWDSFTSDSSIDYESEVRSIVLPVILKKILSRDELNEKVFVVKTGTVYAGIDLLDQNIPIFELG